MQNNDKQKLKKQLEQEAKKLVDTEGDELVVSLISTCSALLKMSEKSIEGRNISDEVYAVYLSFAKRIKTFYDLHSKNNDANTEQNVAEELQKLLEEVQRRQNEENELSWQLTDAVKSNEELRIQIETNKKKLEEQQHIEDTLQKMLLDCTPEMVDEQKKKNDDVLSSLNQHKKILSDLKDKHMEMLSEKQQVADEITSIEESIKEIPKELVSLRTKYKELEVLLNELKNAATEFSTERRSELQKEIDELTPIVEENKVTTEILQNRKESLEKQNIRYDKERQVLTTDLIDIVTTSMEQLKVAMKDHADFLGDTEKTAETLATNLINCQKKREEFSHWFEVVETPLQAMMAKIGHPENIELRKTLNINQVQTVKNALEETRKNLMKLDNILSECALATQKDLQIVKRRAGQ